MVQNRPRLDFYVHSIIIRLMAKEGWYLKMFGPAVGLVRYTIDAQSKIEYSVGDLYNGIPVVSKQNEGDLICVDRSESLCPTCVASGWAAKFGCEFPITENSVETNPKV